jgi:hypothetical protein
MSNHPEEASADMRSMARMMRDMYVALIAEGFTDQQAVQLLGQTIAASMIANKDNP